MSHRRTKKARKLARQQAQEMILRGAPPPDNSTVVQFRMVKKRMRDGSRAVVERGQVVRHPSSMKALVRQLRRILEKS